MKAGDAATDDKNKLNKDAAAPPAGNYAPVLYSAALQSPADTP